MKYINADKLKVEIEKRQEELSDHNFHSMADEYDKVLDIINSLQQDKDAVELELCSQVWWEEQGWIMIPPNVTIKGIDSLLKAVKRKLQQENSNSTSCDGNIFLHQPDMDLKKFTQKMDDWKAKYAHPDSIPINATMAFTARMFYQYPDVAMQWYESLPKATMDENNKK